MKILILGLNYAPEMVGIAVYTTGLAEALSLRGHEVHVVAGKPYYPDWVVPGAYKGGWKRRTLENGVDVTRVAHYVPSDPTGARRIAHHASFALSSLPSTLSRAVRLRPDVVFTIAPSLIAAPVARVAAAACGARSWLHIQDFEVEAAMATGFLGGSGLGASVARLFERAVLNSFDCVSSISPAMCRKVVEKGVAPECVVEFRNWADIDRIVPLNGPSPYRDAWGIKTPHVALYSGNIANKQGIEIVVDAARRLAHRDDVTFVVCGNGPNRANLEHLGAELENIVFHDLQPTERLNDLLGLATVHLLPQLGTAADLVLPSKLTNMLASGRPVVVTAHEGTGLYGEVEGCGVIVPPEDGSAFAEAIATLIDDKGSRIALGAAARLRAQERWQYAQIVSRLEAQLEQLTSRETVLSAHQA
ncbi:colanic acid biosynthesis glycosyltransferase WcaI (plasmid) [Rhizobium sp. WL3]|uniref:WcaI family glycosyltransferase n=1 Tax=Rhizobium sp. WL3 TaxID=2603277 RepID=UPI0011C1F50D|nr:WcaI family glycosyltransferase [Rhizobium sp. WL3]QEE43366.1 colanic acid biosynthesis glycosyltransferase WcaI [Rhizobium sp. WL3]